MSLLNQFPECYSEILTLLIASQQIHNFCMSLTSLIFTLFKNSGISDFLQFALISRKGVE